MDVIYRYDGSFAGFLCCVFESYVNKEPPIGFQAPEGLEPTLFPVRWVAADGGHARRISDSIRRRSAWAGELVEKGFLTCRKEGKTNRYTPLVSREAYQRSEGRSFLDKLYGGSLSRFAAALYDGERVAPEEVADLQALLDQLKEGNP